MARNVSFAIFRRPQPEGGRWAVNPNNILAIWEAPNKEKDPVTHLYLSDCLIIEVIGTFREVQVAINDAVERSD